MGYRGRLIEPFIATVHRVDTSGTEAVAGGGYDPDFRATKHSYPGNVGARASTRRELAPVDLRCQVEMGRWENQRQVASGNAPDSDLTLVFHFRELEALGLVDSVSGDALLRVNDRLSEIKRVSDGLRVQAVRNPPGLFATEVQPAAFGLGGERNLLIVVFADRPQGLTT
jgi:hypothetical protein